MINEQPTSEQTLAPDTEEKLPKITYFDKLCGVRDGRKVYFIVDGIYSTFEDEKTTVELLDLELRKIISRPYKELQKLIRAGTVTYWSPERTRFLEGRLGS